MCAILFNLSLLIICNYLLFLVLFTVLKVKHCCFKHNLQN